jgi:hypothetical protein
VFAGIAKIFLSQSLDSVTGIFQHDANCPVGTNLKND